MVSSKRTRVWSTASRLPNVRVQFAGEAEEYQQGQGGAAIAASGAPVGSRKYSRPQRGCEGVLQHVFVGVL